MTIEPILKTVWSIVVDVAVLVCVFGLAYMLASGMALAVLFLSTGGSLGNN